MGCRCRCTIVDGYGYIDSDSKVIYNICNRGKRFRVISVSYSASDEESAIIISIRDIRDVECAGAQMQLPRNCDVGTSRSGVGTPSRLLR